MGVSPVSTTKAHSRTIVGVLSVFAFCAALFTLASPAGAHHPNIDGDVGCDNPGPGWLVEFTSESWATGSQGANDEIQISYRLRTDGGSAGSWVDLPQKPEYKYDAGNSYEFSDSFTLTPPAGGNEVQLRALAVDNWGNGNAGGQSRDSNWMSLPDDCDPTGSLQIKKVETGETAPGGPYYFDVDGPGDNDFADVEVPANGSTTLDELPLGTYTVTEQNPPPNATLVPNNGVVDITEDGQTVTVTATNPYSSPSASAAPDCSEGGTVVTLTNGGDGPAEFQIYVDDVAFGDPIELTDDSTQVLVPMTEGQTAVIIVQADGRDILEQEVTYDCEDVEIVSAGIDCDAGGYAITVTNHGESPATVSFTKGGESAGDEIVASGDTVTKVIPFDEDETATVSASTNGEIIFEAEVTYDCLEPPTTTTTSTTSTTSTTVEAEVLPVVITQQPAAPLPVTGSGDGVRNMAWLGAGLVLVGGLFLIGRRSRLNAEETL